MTSATPGPGLKAVTGAVRTAARAMRLVDRGQSAFLDLTGGLLGAFLTPAEMGSVTLRLYAMQRGTYDNARGLFGWEREWFDETLPPPPARLLVAAAGEGREVRALRERGYTVDAFEPVPELVQLCLTLAGDGDIAVADFEEFCAAVLDGDAGATRRFADRSYAAVLLGWDSFTHLLDDTTRLRVLKAADRLSPDGPILASFIPLRPGKEPPVSRSRRAGDAVGRAAGRLRGLPPGPAGISMYWHLGFARRYDEAELGEIAAAVGRRLEWRSPVVYGHATFHP